MALEQFDRQERNLLHSFHSGRVDTQKFEIFPIGCTGLGLKAKHLQCGLIEVRTGGDGKYLTRIKHGNGSAGYPVKQQYYTNRHKNVRSPHSFL